MGTFYTDVIQKSPKFNTTQVVGDLDLLEPETRDRVLGIIADAGKRGIKLMVYETYRSTQRQLQLFNQKKTKLKTVGVHHYGLACDIVKDVNGQPSWDGSFAFLGPLAKANGMISGLDWGEPKVAHDFIDSDHVQRCTLGRQKALFAGTWYPDASYNPYADNP